MPERFYRAYRLSIDPWADWVLDSRQKRAGMTRRVAMSYVMTSSQDITQPAAILNTVILDDGAGNTLLRTAAVIVNGYRVALAILIK